MAKSNIWDNIPKDGKINRQDLEELVDLFKNPHPLQASADSTVKSRSEGAQRVRNAPGYDAAKGRRPDQQKARLAQQVKEREYNQNFAGRHGLSGGQQQELSQNGSVWVGNTQFVDLGGTLTAIKRKKLDGSMEIIHKGKN
tara:strand:- start:600 stop:1022 length:423 start_codon:yes stop_codon:yes gene_type:complete